MELELEARAPAHAARPPPRSRAGAAAAWVLSFAVPGLGMFTEVPPAQCPSPPRPRWRTTPRCIEAVFGKGKLVKPCGQLGVSKFER